MYSSKAMAKFETQSGAAAPNTPKPIQANEARSHADYMAEIAADHAAKEAEHEKKRHYIENAVHHALVNGSPDWSHEQIEQLAVVSLVSLILAMSLAFEAFQHWITHKYHHEKKCWK